ncbi:hypothetical protein MNB_SV-12-575 [hydrothermal vent metagenome]|uniref:Uncharacterized protein n=1 Tax=hydrothermal vent metagenome TaxID=652676 RepID=A0A1W1BQ34_9ZZZZ
MQLFKKKTILLSILISAILLNGCTTHQTISTSESHLYNGDFGVVADPQLDATIEQEFLTQNRPAEIDYSKLDPTLSTELIPDPDAVTLENYVEPEPIITYKYMQSPIFYTEDELPENKLITGNAIMR